MWACGKILPKIVRRTDWIITGIQVDALALPSIRKWQGYLVLEFEMECWYNLLYWDSMKTKEVSGSHHELWFRHLHYHPWLIIKTLYYSRIHSSKNNCNSVCSPTKSPQKHTINIYKFVGYRTKPSQDSSKACHSNGSNRIKNFSPSTLLLKSH